MATMTDVARRAGVSTATVSRVLNRSAAVDEATRRQVDEAIAQLRYRPNAVARGLASRSSRTVGVVINRFDSTYYGSLLDGAEKALAALGFKMLAESTHERAEGEREAWASLLERQCDAVVVHSDSLADAELGEWMDEHPRSVLMNRYLEGHGERCIHLDNRRGGALAARILLERGHRSIAMVTGPTTFYEVRDRSAGFIEALEAAATTPIVVEADFLEEGGYRAMMELIDTGRSMTAVFFQNDDMAAGALEACRKRGIGVPDEVSLIGFDDIDVARHLAPKLTTIRQPLREIGAAAGRLAHALATGAADTSAIPRTFEAEVVERASVATLTSPAATVPGRSTGRKTS